MLQAYDEFSRPDRGPPTPPRDRIFFKTVNFLAWRGPFCLSRDSFGIPHELNGFFVP